MARKKTKKPVGPSDETKLPPTSAPVENEVKQQVTVSGSPAEEDAQPSPAQVETTNVAEIAPQANTPDNTNLSEEKVAGADSKPEENFLQCADAVQAPQEAAGEKPQVVAAPDTPLVAPTELLKQEETQKTESQPTADTKDEPAKADGENQDDTEENKGTVKADDDDGQRMSLTAVPLFVANEILKEQAVIEGDEVAFTEVKRKDKRKKNKKEEMQRSAKKNGQAQQVVQSTAEAPEAESVQLTQDEPNKPDQQPAPQAETEVITPDETKVNQAIRGQDIPTPEKLSSDVATPEPAAAEPVAQHDTTAVTQDTPQEVAKSEECMTVNESVGKVHTDEKTEPILEKLAAGEKTEEQTAGHEAETVGQPAVTVLTDSQTNEVAQQIVGDSSAEPFNESASSSSTATAAEIPAANKAPEAAASEEATEKEPEKTTKKQENEIHQEKQTEKSQNNKKNKQQKKPNKQTAVQKENNAKSEQNSDKAEEQKPQTPAESELATPEQKPNQKVDLTVEDQTKEDPVKIDEKSIPREEEAQSIKVEERVQEDPPKVKNAPNEEAKVDPKKKTKEAPRKTEKLTETKVQQKSEVKQETKQKQKKQQKNDTKQQDGYKPARDEEKANSEEKKEKEVECLSEERKPKTISISEDDDGVFEVRPVFLPNTCHVCKEPHSGKTVLKSCAACRMVAYCSAEHQKEHWPEHKQICKFLRKELEKQKKKHIFEAAKNSDYGTWKRMRYTTMMQCEDSIKRPLQPYEREMFLFPRHCETCYETDGEKLHQCKACSSTFFCSIQHKKQDHDRWCAELKLLFDITVQQAKTGRIEPPFPDKVFKEYELLPNSMKEFLVTKMLGPGGVMAYGNVSFSCLTETASYPLTLLYALQKLEEPKSEIEKAAAEERGRPVFTTKPLNDLKSMVIHVVGAELAFECDSIIKWDVFFVHLLPNLQHLRVVFIGPELVSGSGTIPNGICDEDLRCPHCLSADRKIEYDFQPGLLYQDYVSSEQYVKPNVIVAYNCGLYRETGFSGTDTWGPCINAMTADPTIPVVLTAYTSAEAPKDTARVLRTVSSEVLLTPQKNPFRSLKPCRNFVDEESAPVMYKNNYLSVVHGV